MQYLDFVVTNRVKSNDSIKLITEKVHVLDDDITLNDELLKLGDENSDVASAIEQLEALPYGAKHVYVYGNFKRILIEQV